MNKITLLLALSLAGCTMGDNLDRRYTHEIPAQVRLIDNAVCVAVEAAGNEKVTQLTLMAVADPTAQKLYTDEIQPDSDGNVCISANAFSLKNGQDYIATVELQPTGGAAAARRMYSARFHSRIENGSISLIPQ